MPVIKNPRKKVRKTTDKVDTKDEKQTGKSSKGGEGKTKESNIKSRKRKASPPDTDILTAVSHRSHGKTPGDLFVIGDGDCGQFGLGEEVMEAPRPMLTVAGDQKTLQVAAGGMHSVALTESFQLYTTGVNDEGALGRFTGAFTFLHEPHTVTYARLIRGIDAAASEAWKGHEAGKEAGDSYTWGKVDFPATHGHAVQVSAGDSHTCVLTEQGAVYAWGTYRDTTGVYGFSPLTRIALLPTLVWEPKTSNDQAVKIASGTDHAIMLTRGGQVMSWGTAGQGQLGRIGVRHLSRDDKESLLLPHPVKRTKRSRGVSVNTKIVDIACGSYASYAVDEAGKTWAWGLNNYGQIGLMCEEPAMDPHVVQSLKDFEVSEVRGGQHHALALTQEGQLMSFGRGTYGRIGRRDVDPKKDDSHPEARPVDNLEGAAVSGMAAGIMVSGCYSSTGDAYLWGANTSSQLGKGDDDKDESVPLKLKETKRFKNCHVIGMEIGGQMTFILSKLRPADVAAVDQTAGHTPPEPAPADMQA